MDFFIQLFSDPIGFYQSHELLIAQIGINSLLAISIFVTLYSGQLTLANAGFMAVGAYTTVIMSLHLNTPLVVNMLAGSLLAGAVELRGRTPCPATARRLPGDCDPRLWRGPPLRRDFEPSHHRPGAGPEEPPTRTRSTASCRS